MAEEVKKTEEEKKITSRELELKEKQTCADELNAVLKKNGFQLNVIPQVVPNGTGWGLGGLIDLVKANPVNK